MCSLLLIFLASFHLFVDAQYVETLSGTTVGGFSDGPITSAQFKYPTSVAVFDTGDFSGGIVISDSGNNRIRLLFSDSVSSLAGSGLKGFQDGVGTNAVFNSPWSVIIVNSTGANFTLLVCDRENAALRLVTQDGSTTLLAGQVGVTGYEDGVGTNAQFSFFRSAALSGGLLYVADGYRIRLVRLDGTVTSLAGQIGTGGNIDGVGTAATFDVAYSVSPTSTGGVFVACNDNFNHGPVRKVTANGTVTTILANIATEFAAESFLDGRIFISISRFGYISQLDLSSGATSMSNFVGKDSVFGSIDGLGTNANLYNPIGISQAYQGTIYFADYGNHMIRAIVATPPKPSMTPTPTPSHSPTPFTTSAPTPLTTAAVGVALAASFSAVVLIIVSVFVVLHFRYKMATLKVLANKRSSIEESRTQEMSGDDSVGIRPAESESSSESQNDPDAPDFDATNSIFRSSSTLVNALGPRQVVSVTTYNPLALPPAVKLVLV